MGKTKRDRIKAGGKALTRREKEQARAHSVRTESTRGAKRVEQNSRPSRETRGG